MERTRQQKKSTSKLKNSEPIAPTQREMHPSLTERDLLNQEEKTMPAERFQNVRKENVLSAMLIYHSFPHQYLCILMLFLNFVFLSNEGLKGKIHKTHQLIVFII